LAISTSCCSIHRATTLSSLPHPTDGPPPQVTREVPFVRYDASEQAVPVLPSSSHRQAMPEALSSRRQRKTHPANGSMRSATSGPATATALLYYWSIDAHDPRFNPSPTCASAQLPPPWSSFPGEPLPSSAPQIAALHCCDAPRPPSPSIAAVGSPKMAGHHRPSDTGQDLLFCSGPQG
jgi:hypothetical protein